MMKTRSAGILMPISSLPSKYGVGTLGKAAFDFIDKLSQSGLKYWQVLPIGPTSYGDSPYQSFSAFAGNPYFIDLDILCKEGLLKSSDFENLEWFEDIEKVSYELLWENRYKVLRKAFENSNHLEDIEYKKFIKSIKYWIDDYALFMACKAHFENKSWLEWDDDIKFRKNSAIKKYNQLLKDDIDFYKFLQYKFFVQWFAVKKYAHDKKIEIIGDIPIYIALDSADIWANPKMFLLDDDLKPKFVAGCPPDAFSQDGQKWGNPLYNWKNLEQDDFYWWRKRMNFSAKIYDVIRIDHFIGIERYFSIPADGLPVDGFYTSGPQKNLIHAINQSIGNTKIIAEDLGVLTDGVKELLKYSGYPGMKVLQFAFGSDSDNLYLPHNHIKNCILYIGTHDNDTLIGYLSTISEKEIEYIKGYLCCDSEENIAEKIISLAFSSVSDTVILQMQDVLQKDSSARINFPSTTENNWCWRMTPDEFSEENIKYLSKLAIIFNRDNRQ